MVNKSGMLLVLSWNLGVIFLLDQIRKQQDPLFVVEVDRERGVSVMGYHTTLCRGKSETRTMYPNPNF